MKRIAWITILLIAAFVAESRISVMGVGLNLTVLFAYWAGLRYGPVQGTLTGAFVGAAADSVSGGMLGPLMLSKATAGYLASYLRGGLFIWSPFLGFMAAMALTALDGAIAYSCRSVFEPGAAGLGAVARIIFWQSAMNLWAGLLMRPVDEEG